VSPAVDPSLTPLPKGTLVVKINSLPGDRHRDGAKGRVFDPVGPATPESEAPGTYGYWIDFDPYGIHPESRVYVAGTRLRVRQVADVAVQL
jgi:hypothetical protein